MLDHPSVHANNEFALALYQQLIQDQADANVFFSPYSLFSALLMMAEGARGETARQMGAVLHLPPTNHTHPTANEIPWEMSILRTDMAETRHRLASGSGPRAEDTAPITQQMRQLQEERKAIIRQLIQAPRDSSAEIPELERRRFLIADELNQLAYLANDVDRYELTVANAVWGEQTFPFRPEFMTTLQEGYGAAAFPADFLFQAERERQRINEWIAQQTRGRITEVLEPESLSAETCLALANAIYFKGKWQGPFPRSDTQEADFTYADGRQGKVAMMADRDRRRRYVELRPDGATNHPVFNRERETYEEAPPNPDGVQLLELPYQGDTLSMVIVLPKRVDGLAALEERLTLSRLNQWIAAMYDSRVHVYIPKYKLETGYSLEATLERMGMPAAFAPGGFLGVSAAPEAHLLALSTVSHKAYVEVNEEGTVAAAATVITAQQVSLRIEPPPPTFRADHPFLFLIRENHSGLLLFLGRVLTP